MAARILHRLRHVLEGAGAGEGGGGGAGPGAEDCPESSELEDDTEGLSTRLSGTLSFSSHDEDEDEDEDGDGGEDGGDRAAPGPPGDAAAAGSGGELERAPGQQPADTPAPGPVAEVAQLPGAAAPALRGHQRQRGQRALLQIRALHHLPDPLGPVRQGARHHRPALLRLRAPEPAPARAVWQRPGRRCLPPQAAAAQLHGRDHRQAQPRLRAVPVPPARHGRGAALPRLPGVLLPARPADRAAPHLQRHVPRGPGRLEQRLPAARQAGRLQLGPLPAHAGRPGRVPAGAGPARRGAPPLRAGPAAAGDPARPPAAGALPPGPRAPVLEGGQGQAPVGGPAAGPAGGRGGAGPAALPEGVPHQGDTGLRPGGRSGRCARDGEGSVAGGRLAGPRPGPAGERGQHAAPLLGSWKKPFDGWPKGSFPGLGTRPPCARGCRSSLAGAAGSKEVPDGMFWCQADRPGQLWPGLGL